MDYFSIEMDGQPLSTRVPQGIGNNLVQGNTQANMAGSLGPDSANVSSDITLKFNDFDHIREWMDKERPVKAVISDLTYPSHPEQQRKWVKAIVFALHNQQDIIDGDKLRAQWGRMVRENSLSIELTAWKFLMKAMLYHNLQGKLEPLNRETDRARPWDNFADHMNYMLKETTNKKTLCRHLSTDYWTSAFIDAPEMHAQRVISNLKINNAKKRKAEYTSTVAKLAIKGRDQNGNIDPQVQEELQKLQDDYKTETFRIKQEHEETTTLDQATGPALRKKPIRPKLIPISQKVLRKRKSSDAEKDDGDDPTYADLPDTACTLVDPSQLYHLGKLESSPSLPQHPDNMTKGAGNVNYYQEFSRVPQNNYNEPTQFSSDQERLIRYGGVYGYAPQDYQEISRTPSLQGWQNNAVASSMSDANDVGGYSYIFMDSDNENTNTITPHLSQETTTTVTESGSVFFSPPHQNGAGNHSRNPSPYGYGTGNPTIDPSLLTLRRPNRQTDFRAPHIVSPMSWAGVTSSNNLRGESSGAYPAEKHPYCNMDLGGSNYPWATR